MPDLGRSKKHWPRGNLQATLPYSPIRPSDSGSMDFIFCIPILIGCPTKVSPDGNQGSRICPRCHNASMFAAKSRTWFEFCFVPLIPFKSKHVWMCGICQLQTEMQPGWAPPLAQPGYQHPDGQNQYGPPPVGAPQNYGKDYQPGYIHTG